MRNLFIIVMLLWSVGAWGQSSSVNLAIPSSPQSFQSDRVRSGQFECSQAIGSSTNVEFGVVGLLNQNGPYGNQFGTSNIVVEPDGYNQNDFVRDVGVYAKITVPIGAPKKRLDCNRLYELELRARELEIKKLEAEVANLRNMKFANDGQ
jgi:hypothetical protein